MVKMIALDLDGTLLNSSKQLSEPNRKALERASGEGVQIVPATGRFYSAMPQVVRELECVRYAIVANGARVLELPEKRAVSSADIPLDRTLELMTYLDTLPVIYDCFLDDAAWTSAEHSRQIDDFILNPHYRKMFHEMRTPVPNLKKFVRDRNQGVMKSQFFFRGPEKRDWYISEIRSHFPELSVSSSVENNVEINSSEADKGKALRSLAAYLGIPVEETAAFGDGLNDLTMLCAAGIGIAMGNAEDTVKSRAKMVAPDCDSDGVAVMIGQLLGW